MVISKAQTLPLVAIIGRPNVGKSTLFNRLIGERRSIVGDEPGITRDRIYGEADWRTKRFAIVDTGGIVPDDDAVIPANILKQAGFAIDQARSAHLGRRCAQGNHAAGSGIGAAAALDRKARAGGGEQSGCR